MRKFIRFKSDGEREELTPLTFEEFTSLGLCAGADDVEWRRWLVHNELVEVREYTDEALADSVVEIDPIAVRILEFNPSGDGVTWESLHDLAIGMYPLDRPWYERE